MGTKTLRGASRVFVPAPSVETMRNVTRVAASTKDRLSVCAKKALLTLRVNLRYFLTLIRTNSASPTCVHKIAVDLNPLAMRLKVANTQQLSTMHFNLLNHRHSSAFVQQVKVTLKCLTSRSNHTF